MVRLNLGCGSRHIDEYTNIDMDATCEPDVLLDICAGLPYDDNSVSEVRVFDFLEHIPASKTIYVVDEIWRVLKPGGKFEHFTPSTDGRGAFQDPTHISFWNINSWLYFCEGTCAGMYGIKSRFKVEYIRDIITSDALNIIHTHGILRKEQT